MNDILRGNAVVAQSGGPTSVINSSACGVIQAAIASENIISRIFGANNGILGILHEDLFDLTAESRDTIEGLRRTPSSAIGSCRFKLGDLKKDRFRYERILSVFQAHDIRYFFYIGGNDSMDTANKVHQLAEETGYGLRVMGVPKTIDNDLVGTDHCPGFGSVAKFLATAVMEAGRDTEALHTFDPVTITEAMGRNTGWIAASAGLAQREEIDAPHLIYVPEIAFSISKFLDDVKRVYAKLGRVSIVVSEGIVDKNGNLVSAGSTKDAFGHVQLGGVAAYLQQIVTAELGLKCRHNRLDICQRNAMHFASMTDSDEAYKCGSEAVHNAVSGKSGFMVSLVRDDSSTYSCRMGLTLLSEVANGVKKLPRSFMNEDGTHISPVMRDFAGPLIRGEVPIRVAADGLPEFVRFERKPVKKRLPEFLDD